MSTLYPTDLHALSDALQMELYIGEKNAVTGKVVRPISIPELGMKLNLQLKILSSKVTTSEREPILISLLIHVAGDLYLLAQNDIVGGRVNVLLMNGAKLPARPALEDYFAKDKRQMKSIMPMFEAAAVGTFSRQHYDKAWKPVAKAA